MNGCILVHSRDMPPRNFCRHSGSIHVKRSSIDLKCDDKVCIGHIILEVGCSVGPHPTFHITVKQEGA